MIARGGLGFFPPEVIVQVKALACELPATRGVPLARWSRAELARYVQDTGLVGTISGSTIWRWLYLAALDVHRARVVGRCEAVAVGRVGDLSDPAEGAHLAAPHPGHEGRRRGLLPGPARRRTEPGRGTHRPGSRRLPSDRRRPRPDPPLRGRRPRHLPSEVPRNSASPGARRPGGHGRLGQVHGVEAAPIEGDLVGLHPSAAASAGAGADRAHLSVGFRPLPQNNPSGPTVRLSALGTGLFSASAISSSNSASRSGANHVEPNSPHPTAPRGATRTLWCLTVSEYPPRGRAGDELRQVARWLAETLAQPDMLKGAAAHAS